MKVFSIPFFLLICVTVGVTLTPPLGAVEEFTKVKQPTEEQKFTIKRLYGDIAEVQTDINLYFKDLQERNKIRNDSTVIPLTSVIQVKYGERGRNIFNEHVTIKWNGDKAVSYVFSQRQALIGSGQVIKKRLSASSIAGEVIEDDKTLGNKAMNLYVNEILTSGKGLTINFRFPTEEDLRDREEIIDVDGRKVKVLVVFVRQPNEKIRILREFYRLLKLTLRRIDWMVRVEEERKAAEIQRLLNLTE
jgi:hypothetical protein